MGNQLIREQIIEILESDYCDGGPTIGSIADKIEHLVNQEVERRIAERMPSEEEIETQVIIKMQRDTKDGRIGILIDGTYADVFIDASEWLRSRLTNDSQKTEGGTK